MPYEKDVYMTVMARMAKDKPSKEVSVITSGDSFLESFKASEAIVTEKFQALIEKKAECQAAIQRSKYRVHRWVDIVKTAKREDGLSLSDNAKKALAKLATQAENYLRSTQKELDMYEKLLSNILTQLSAIEEMKVRLKNSAYEIQLQKKFKDLQSKSLEGFSFTEDISFNLEEIERDVKRLEYTSEALLEIGEMK